MVDVRVRQHDRIDARGGEGEVGPVALAQVLQSLEFATVEQYLPTPERYEVARARDGAGRAAECQGGTIVHARVLAQKNPAGSPHRPGRTLARA